MTESLCIKPLRCGRCGRELPVMGRLVTFQCPGCFSYWVLTEDDLAPITVYRAATAGDNHPQSSAERCIYLPFWVTEVDGPGLRDQIGAAVRELHRTAQAVLQTGFEGDPGERLPAASEIEALSKRIESIGVFKIYIPAFKSLNTYAYLKVGRLLTRVQPAYEIDRSAGAGHTVPCALKAEEAVALMDYIFFATLPESIQAMGAFLERIRLAPARPPLLVEFPFRERGASLVSIVGGFWISGRLVEGVESLVE